MGKIPWKTVCVILVVIVLIVVITTSVNQENYTPSMAVQDQVIQKKYFTLPQGKWLGGDSATSFKIDDVTYLWIFGDTFIGELTNGARPTGSAFIHQSVGVNKNGHMDYRWASKNGVPTTAVDPIKQDGYYWFLAGIQPEFPGPTLLVASRIVPAHNFLGFDVAATSLIKIQNILDPPTKWKYTNIDLPASKFGKVDWTSAMERNPKNHDEMYILGVDNTLHSFVLAKAPIEDWVKFDFSTTKFWSNGDKWVDNANNLKPLFGKNTAGNETSLVYKNGKWYSMAIPAMTNKLILYWANNITGKWVSKQIYTIPLPKNGITYAPKFHPELSGPDDLVITYNVNMTGDGSKELFTKEGVSIYVPKVLRVQI
jgi:hypothetical protein